MKVKKVCVVITARPSYSRIKSVLKAIDDNPYLKLQLVVAASALLDRYGSAIDSIEKDGFKVTKRVYMVMEGENLTNMAKSTGIGLMELSTVFDNLKPDYVMTIADRYETMATAVAAAYMNIPVIHIQGGEVTGSIDEKVRHAITKLSDLHYVANETSAQRVAKMGERDESIFITGCPSIDLARDIGQQEGLAFDPYEKYGGVGNQIDLSNGYVVLMQHPVTTEYKEARKQVEKTLHAIKCLNLPTLLFWPNVDAGSDGLSKGIRYFRETYDLKNVHFFKNMLPEDFLNLLCNSLCIVGNSSVAIRECSFLGVPAVNIGSRQEGRDRGRNTLDVDYDKMQIKQAIQSQCDHGFYEKDTLYGDGYAGDRIADLLTNASTNINKRLAY